MFYWLNYTNSKVSLLFDYLCIIRLNVIVWIGVGLTCCFGRLCFGLN